MKDLLLITPPFTQLNTPYPGTVYLKGFLNTIDVSSHQMDLGIEVILEIFSKEGLTKLFNYAIEQQTILEENEQRILGLKTNYINTIDGVISFLQGQNSALARQICNENFLPQASRFNQLDELEWAFGNMGMQDKAKHLATLYLEDLADFITNCVDSNFGFSRYAERLGRSANSFDELYNTINGEASYIDAITLAILEDKLKETNPKLVCFSVPFPGNLYSAFKCAQYIKQKYPELKTAMGGGFPNTELREIKDVRVFDYFDYITLDDGELPIELVTKDVLEPNKASRELKRTFVKENGEVVYINSSTKSDYKQTQVGTPDYSDLPLTKYISVIEVANPMHSLWSDGRWNKLTMAHGCYWGKCTFCDVSLDYISLYEPIAANVLVDRMEQMIAQTGETGFHFVDEAAPPALMRALALEILKRELTVTWWTNIRFEKSFTADLCKLLQASGCIAVSGGLEVASDRLLELIKKGVTVEQVAKVTSHLTDAGIMVHAYLMYGYPTQTIQETVDSLEMVRQLFELGIIQSGFWHQFALTAHSPVGQNPEEYNIEPHLKEISFANNDIDFKDKTGIDHGKFSFGLKKSLFNYMHGVGFELPLKKWFDFKLPQTTINPYFIEDCLATPANDFSKPNAKVVWLGNEPVKHNQDYVFYTKTQEATININPAIEDWLINLLGELAVTQFKGHTIGSIKKSYEKEYGNFEMFWYSDTVSQLKEVGLLVL